MSNFSFYRIEPEHNTRIDSIATDPTAQRRFLRELARACTEGASSPDAHVTRLALGLVAVQSLGLACAQIGGQTR